MSDGEYLSLLRRKVDQILRKSPGIEGMAVGKTPLGDPAAPAAPHLEAAELEAVVRWYRPVLTITDDRFVTTTSSQTSDVRFTDPNAAASKALLAELETQRGKLDPVIRSVGRIELVNNSRLPWAGTGWIIGSDLGSDIVVTNAHVGREFAQRSGGGFVFRPGVPDASLWQAARIDFREEVNGTSAREFPITEVLWVSEDASLDICLLRVARNAGTDRIDPPIQLLDSEPGDNQMVAVIGYPGSNNGYDPAAFLKLFGSVTGTKRFSPGFYSGRRGASITYDCSTLPGSSGSVVVDVMTGKAVGLHFAGTALEANFGVPGRDVAGVLKKRPWQGGSTTASTVLADTVSGSSEATPLPANLSFSTQLTIPLQISIGLGGDAQIAVSATPVDSAAAKTLPRKDRAAAEAAAARVRQHLIGRKDALAVKAGYLFAADEITDDFGVIVGVAPGTAIDHGALGLAKTIDGVTIAVENADPRTIAEQMLAFNTEAFGGRRANYKRDLRDPKFNLDPVTDDMTITLHVSPEAGWPVLRDFLADESSHHLTIGMYHMTAPHVVKAIKAIAKREDSTITLTLDRQRGDADVPDDIGGPTKADDIPEEETLARLKVIAKRRFAWAPASLGGSGLFPTAYHIKVAVWSDAAKDADSAHTFWLSSGNWQSSNQPLIDVPVDNIGEVTEADVEDYNREWHAMVASPRLARTFRNHLEQDYEDNRSAAEKEAPTPAMPDVLVPIEMMVEAPRPRAFKPFAPEILQGEIKVQPLLTPDNYPDVITKLIGKAKKRVLIENQSFNFWKDIDSTPEHFLDIVKAVRDRQEQGLDVRIIFRSGFGKERDTLRQMKEFGFKVDASHVRYFDKCHTKGIVIDDDIAVLGSQNWTAAGTGPNRDASLVIWNKDANAYFAKVFEYDWKNVAQNRSRARENMSPIKFALAGDESPAPSGYRRLPLSEFLGET